MGIEKQNEQYRSTARYRDAWESKNITDELADGSMWELKNTIEVCWKFVPNWVHSLNI
jgi:hypothetical protein